MILGEAGFTPQRIETSAAVSLDPVDGGFAITAIHLSVKAQVPGASEAQFSQCAKAAKAGCPVSKVLNAAITMDATLES